MRKSYIVQVDLPEGCTAAAMREYMVEALLVWNREMDKSDPLSKLDLSTIRITQLPTVGDN